MMRYINRPLIALAVAITIISGLETPFNTFSYSLIFYMIERKKIELIVPLILMVVGGYAFFSIIAYIKSKLVNKNIIYINQVVKSSYVLNNMEKVTTKQDHNSNYEADSISFFLNDLKLLEDNYWRQLFTLINAAVTAVGTFLIAVYSNWALTMIFITFTIIPTIMPKLFTKRIQLKTDLWSKMNQNLSSVVRDLFHGALLLTRFNSLTGFNRRLNESIRDVENANADLKNEIAFSNSLIGFLFYAFSYIPIGIGIYFTITGKILLAQFVAIQYSSSWILNSLNSIVSSVNTINSTKRIRDAIPVSFRESSVTSATKKMHFNELSLEKISFSYGETPIFLNLSLDIVKGDKVLIEGQSGIGKSTLIRIILKELRPSKGELAINKSDYTKGDAYSLMGVVGQAPVIFKDTIRNNLALGNNFSDLDIFNALKEAGLQRFANSEGVMHVISENGGNLSGGQLKRIEIARALLFNKKILIVDEGTASLDPKTAADIHRTILQVPDLTVIEVDHNISSEILPLYSSHYVLEDGGLFVK